MWCAVSCIWRGVALIIIIIMSMIINIICSIIFIRRFALLYQIHTTELDVAIFKYICQTYPSSYYTSKSKVRAQCLVWRGELRAQNCQWKCSFFFIQTYLFGPNWTCIQKYIRNEYESLRFSFQIWQNA